MSEWSNMSVCGMLFQWTSTKNSTIKACWFSTKWTSSSFHRNVTYSHHDIAEKLPICWFGIKQQSHTLASLCWERFWVSIGIEVWHWCLVGTGFDFNMFHCPGHVWLLGLWIRSDLACVVDNYFTWSKDHMVYCYHIRVMN